LCDKQRLDLVTTKHESIADSSHHVSHAAAAPAQWYVVHGVRHPVAAAGHRITDVCVSTRKGDEAIAPLVLQSTPTDNPKSIR
jgi:hypothetical protein